MNKSRLQTRIGWQVLGVLCLASGCTVITNLDRFEAADAGEPPDDSKDNKDDAGGNAGSGARAGSGGSDAMKPSLGCDNPRTLCLRVKNFTPHLDELVQADLVTNEDNTLRARAILDPLGVGSADADIVLPLAIPAREVPKAGEDSPLHLEIYADQNKDRMYTPKEDHDWNVDVPADGKVVFPHNSDFSTLTPAPRDLGADFRINFKGMDAHIGRMLEVMVIQIVDGENDRTVGLYRLQSIEKPDFTLTIPGIIDPGNISYLVEFFADADEKGNRRYDGHPIDHSWTRDGESGDDGFEVDFTHGTEFMDLHYQFVFEP